MMPGRKDTGNPQEKFPLNECLIYIKKKAIKNLLLEITLGKVYL